jgi:uncharacterized membrane protein YqjE
MKETRENEGPAAAVKQLASDITLIVRQEIEAARDEMTGKVKAAGVGAGMLSGSAIAALFTLASLTALVMVALARAVPLWASMLIVTVLWGLATAVLGLMGRKKVEDAAPFVPERTIANVKEDVRLARRGETPARR